MESKDNKTNIMTNNITRRRFLGQVNCAAIGSLPILNTLLNLKLAGTIAASTPGNTDYRALVCLFLSGGIDTFNVLVPRGDSEYAEYAAVRGAIALPQASLLPITPAGLSGLELGLHPGLTNVQSLFEGGKAALVTNVGTLVEPVTKDEYNNGLKPLPLGLYSHSDQQEQWQTSMPSVRSSKGWAGRAADLLGSLNSNDTISMNVSLTGQNIWQSGEGAFAYTVNSDGAVALDGYDPTNTDQWSTVPIRTKAVDSQLAFNYQHLLTQAFATAKKKAMDAYALFNSATNITLPANVTFPTSDLANNLMMVAKAIAGHSAMGHTRQTFFIEYGGWDHHDKLLVSQAAMLPEVDAALKAFYDCLATLGLSDKVTLFTASDFARTLTTDSDGADHAWGGNHLVIGGAVNGHRLYGTYPRLYVDNPLDVGRGRIIPQIPVDSYFAELALWLGVSPSDLHLVVPNISAFYDVSSSGAPVGFLG
jgi:uncharacterized protein (DUF1501 family)